MLKPSARSKHDASAAPVPPPTTASPLLVLFPALAVVAAALLTFSGALDYFFAQDDFVGLARTQGLVERLEAPWRFLSRQVFFDVMHAVAGLDARPYHWASLLGHAATAALLLGVLSRQLGRPAALVGAVYFAVHPTLFRALY